MMNEFKMHFSISRFFLPVLFAVVLGFGMFPACGVYAQDGTDDGVADESTADIVQDLYRILDHQNKLKELDITPEYIRTIPTLFFTKWQHALLVETRAGARNRPITAAEVGEDGRIVKGPREISLSGIVYKSKDRWTIWLNNQRVAPDAIPEEVMDLNVYAEHIEIEWFDAYTNQIYPIRLRPHQRFNLDSRIFLPGIGVAN